MPENGTSTSGKERGEFRFACPKDGCIESWSGDDLAPIAQSVARHWNREHGDDLEHRYEAIDEVQLGGHHLAGNSYEVRKYTVYITSFDVIRRIGAIDGYAVPSDPDRVCDECLRYIEDSEDRVEEDPDDPFNDDWTCRACLKEQEIERRAEENQDLGQYVTDGGAIPAGRCPNCGPVTGDSVALNFPNQPECQDCGANLELAGYLDEAGGVRDV